MILLFHRAEFLNLKTSSGKLRQNIILWCVLMCLLVGWGGWMIESMDKDRTKEFQVTHKQDFIPRPDGHLPD